MGAPGIRTGIARAEASVAAPSSVAFLPHLHPAQDLLHPPQFEPESLHPEDDPWQSQIKRTALVLLPLPDYAGRAAYAARHL